MHNPFTGTGLRGGRRELDPTATLRTAVPIVLGAYGQEEERQEGREDVHRERRRDRRVRRCRDDDNFLHISDGAAGARVPIQVRTFREDFRTFPCSGASWSHRKARGPGCGLTSPLRSRSPPRSILCGAAS